MVSCMFRQVNASNFQLGAGLPNIRGLVGNLSHITPGLVKPNPDRLRGARELCPFPGSKAHGKVRRHRVQAARGRGDMQR